MSQETVTMVMVASVSYLRPSSEKPRKQVRHSQSKPAHEFCLIERKIVLIDFIIPVLAQWPSLRSLNSSGPLLLLTFLILSAVSHSEDCSFILKSLSYFLKTIVSSFFLETSLFFSLSSGFPSYSEISEYSSTKAQSMGLFSPPLHSLYDIIILE